jgi:mono/diheme cytochrome c family protein
LVSPVIANAAVRQKDYPALVVLNGLAGLLPLADGSTMAGVMPSQQSLTDEEAAAVVSYIYRLNHAKTAIKAQDIGRLRTQPASADDLRRAHKDLLK